jgi:PAS domain S-box-containing protein
MSPDGRLWFANENVLQMIDPLHLEDNPIPPPVHVEEIIADHKSYAPQDGLRLPTLTRDLQIDYTALSFVIPQKVRFRYKLEGHDADWQDPGTRRQAFYADLRPGNYRFRVIACNNDGVWNDEGATLAFIMAAAWYQTWWFRVICVAAFAALLWGWYQLRIRQVRSQEKKLRDVIETIPTFAWSALPDGSIDFVNRHWEEYTGISSGKTVGSGWEAAVYPEDVKRYAEKWRGAVESGIPFEGEVRFRRAADAQYRWFLTRAVPLRDARGKILKWYGTSTDIDDREHAKQLQADLAHINRVTTMGELTASLAHELKQPIAATVTNANACFRWLKREKPDL